MSTRLLELQRAAEAGSLDIVQHILLSTGNNDGQNGARQQQERRRQQPQAQHPDVEITTMTTTITTSSSGQDNMMSLLLTTALHAASGRGHEHIVEWLLHVAAESSENDDNNNNNNSTATPQRITLDVNATQRGGWRALHLACHGKHGAVVKRLLQAGANPHLCLSNGQSALHVACAQDHNLSVVRLLVEHAKAKHNNPNTLSLSSSSLVHSTDKSGWTPLHVAAFHGRVDIVHYLLVSPHAQANVEHKNRDGQTPFALTASQCPKQQRPYVRRLAVLRTLVVYGKANVDCYDHTGRTALECAIERRDMSMICFLTRQCGATVRLVDLQKAYQTPNALYPLVAAATSQGFFSVRSSNASDMVTDE